MQQHELFEFLLDTLAELTTLHVAAAAAAEQAWATLGKEAAKVLLGHASTSTTEIYLLEEVQEAMKVAKAFSS
jgi:hypothetical protein